MVDHKLRHIRNRLRNNLISRLASDYVQLPLRYHEGVGQWPKIVGIQGKRTAFEASSRGINRPPLRIPLPLSHAMSRLVFEDPPIDNPNGGSGCGSAVLSWRGGTAPFEVTASVTTANGNPINSRYSSQELPDRKRAFPIEMALRSSRENRLKSGTFTVDDADGNTIRVEGAFDFSCSFFNVDIALPPSSSSTMEKTSITSSTQTTTTSASTSASPTISTTASSTTTTTSSTTTSATLITKSSSSATTLSHPSSSIQNSLSQSSTKNPQPITSSVVAKTASSVAPPSGNLGNHMKSGVVAGIVSAIIATILLFVLIAFCVVRKRKQRSEFKARFSAISFTGSAMKSGYTAQPSTSTLSIENPGVPRPTGRPLEAIQGTISRIRSRSLPAPPSPRDNVIPSAPRTPLPLYDPEREDVPASERELILQRQVDILLSENARLAGQLQPPAYRNSS